MHEGSKRDSSISDDVSGEYAAILGTKPEKYQTKVLLFQVRLNINNNSSCHVIQRYEMWKDYTG